MTTYNRFGEAEQMSDRELFDLIGRATRRQSGHRPPLAKSLDRTDALIRQTDAAGHADRGEKRFPPSQRRNQAGRIVGSAAKDAVADLARHAKAITPIKPVILRVGKEATDADLLAGLGDAVAAGKLSAMAAQAVQVAVLQGEALPASVRAILGGAPTGRKPLLPDRELLGGLSDAVARGRLSATAAVEAERLVHAGQPMSTAVRAVLLAS